MTRLVKIEGQKILEYFYEFYKIVIEKSFINWPVLSLVKINTGNSENILYKFMENLVRTFNKNTREI
jgi:hypothetical protein